MDIISDLRLEQANLEAELKLIPTFRRLEAVRAAIKVLTEAYDGQTSVDTRMPITPVVTPVTSAPRTRRSSQTARVAEMAEELFRTTNKRHQSGEVYKYLESKGIAPIEGKKPSSVVSSILSHNPLFHNGYDDHGVGYGLSEWTLQSGQLDKSPDYDLLEKAALGQAAENEKKPAEKAAGV